MQQYNLPQRRKERYAHAHHSYLHSRNNIAFTVQPYGIEVNSAQRCYYICPDTEKKREQWIAALQKAATLRRQQGSTAQKPSSGGGLRSSILPKAVAKQETSPRTTASGRKVSRDPSHV